MDDGDFVLRQGFVSPHTFLYGVTGPGLQRGRFCPLLRVESRRFPDELSLDFPGRIRHIHAYNPAQLRRAITPRP